MRVRACVTRNAPIAAATAPDAPMSGIALSGAASFCASAARMPAPRKNGTKTRRPQRSSRLLAQSHMNHMLKMRCSHPPCMNIDVNSPSTLFFFGT